MTPWGKEMYPGIGFFTLGGTKQRRDNKSNLLRLKKEEHQIRL